MDQAPSSRPEKCQETAQHPQVELTTSDLEGKRKKSPPETQTEEDSHDHEVFTCPAPSFGDYLEVTTEDDQPRPGLTTSNSAVDIMLGLETDDGKSAEVEIDSLETEERVYEEIPKGRVRKTSIVDKISKSKESELLALSILETAGQRQREFEKLIHEHQEIVQEISRTPSSENIVQNEVERDP